MRRRLRMDVLEPSTEWCWLHGPREVRLPGASLDALASALAAGGSGALLVYRGHGYVLRWEDCPPWPEEGDAVRAMRRYELTCRYRYRAPRRASDGRSLPGPFVQLVALLREDRGGDLSGVDGRSMRDAIWWLLSRAGEALDAVG